MATKYNTLILIVGICSCLSEYLVKGLEMNCHFDKSELCKLADGKFFTGGMKNLNDYCVSVGTFLVEKHLASELINDVISPGLGPYNKYKDSIIKYGNIKLIC